MPNGVAPAAGTSTLLGRHHGAARQAISRVLRQLTGGGEVTHYLGRHGESRVAMAALISAVPPLMVKTAANPHGLPKEVFDGLQAQLAASRSKFYRELPEGPFYGYNRPGAKLSEAVGARGKLSGRQEKLSRAVAGMRTASDALVN